MFFRECSYKNSLVKDIWQDILREVEVEYEEPLVESDDFLVALSEVVAPLQATLRTLYEELGRPKNTVVMQRQLGVGNTICWQVMRIIRANSAVGVAMHAPLPLAMFQFIEAAERVGVSARVISDVRRASERFRMFVKERAADQSAFQTMVAGVSEEDDGEKIQIRHRRAAYRADSHIWGVQRDVYGIIMFVRRSQEGDFYDLALLMCQFGYRRLRSRASATVFAFGDVAEWGDSMRSLDAEAMEKYGAPLVAEFCSNPIPQLERVPLASGQNVFRLADKSLGQVGSKDLTAGIIYTQAGPVSPGGLILDKHRQSFFCPTGRFVASLFVDRETLGQNVPSLTTRLVGFAEDDPRGEPLPLSERVMPVGPANRAPRVKDIPNYGRAIDYVARSTGWALDRFENYQLTMDFPVFASELTFSFARDGQAPASQDPFAAEHAKP